MPEVQNVGAVDYAQYQPSQYQPEVYAEEYNTQPEVYDEQMEEMKAANKSRLGANILSGVIAAGVGGTIGFLLGKRGKVAKSEFEAVKKELENLQNSEAVKNYDGMKKGLEELEKLAEENDKKFFGWMKNGKEFKQKLSKFFEPYKKAAEEAKESAENAKDAVEEVADDVAKEVKSSAEAKRPTHS